MATRGTVSLKDFMRKTCKVQARVVLVGELLQVSEHVDFVEDGRGLGIIISLHGNLQGGIFFRPTFEVSNKIIVS